MKEKMRKGDQVLFYHSNCKVPGIAGIAEIHKEGYPDFTAFDSSHPYYDPKSVESKPTWFMVDIKFVSRFPNFVPLKLLQNLISGKVSLPDYSTSEDLQAIKDMPLLNRGRLSVQPVPAEAFEVIRNLGVNGGWPSAEKAATSTSGPKPTSPCQSEGAKSDTRSNKRKKPSQTTQTRRSKRYKV